MSRHAILAAIGVSVLLAAGALAQAPKAGQLQRKEGGAKADLTVQAPLPLAEIGAKFRERISKWRKNKSEGGDRPDTININGNIFTYRETIPRDSTELPLAILTAPGTMGVGQIAAGAVELANTDMSQSFVDLRLPSAGFTASSRLIR